MTIETLPIENIPGMEGIGKFIGLIVAFFGGIAGIYLLAAIMRWVYNIRFLNALKDIKEELEILNKKKKKNVSKNK